MEDSKHLRTIFEKNGKSRYNYSKMIANKIRSTSFNDSLKRQYTLFINSQFDMAKKFYINLSKQKGGKDKTKKIFGISDKQYKRWFEKWGLKLIK